eukprot:COSAG02_NODE_561_length_20308_cov_42.799495_15_plen_67_part_00
MASMSYDSYLSSPRFGCSPAFRDCARMYRPNNTALPSDLGSLTLCADDDGLVERHRAQEDAGRRER